jgi:RimJ/RimL family protein N-acetyltransferase
VEVGWHLHPDAWGNGYATEAARAVVADAFSRGQRRIVAVTHPDNKPSHAVCRRVGMQHLGTTTRYMGTSCELFELVGRP